MTSLAVALLLASDLPTAGPPAADAPRPVPLTRPEMKQSLEDMKLRQPRIPLPELTPAETALSGERDVGYEARLRRLYLPRGEGQGGAGGFGVGRESDPNMSLDYRFKTQLFWIVSRANNCQY